MMMVVDRELKRREAEGRPIRVGIVGAGCMGRALALQIARFTPGMAVVAVAGRTLDHARRACSEAGLEPVVASDAGAVDRNTRRGTCSVTDDAGLVCRAASVEVVVEATGSVEYAAGVSLDAIGNGKHLVLLNAELDATLGPILKSRADAAGVVMTNVDGDQPGVTMNLLRFAKQIGCRPVLAGNIKGLQDHYRNPTTQKGFAEKWGQNPRMITSFADGSKISFEQAVIANATGMRVGRRGMYGPQVPNGTHVERAAEWYPMEAIPECGVVDYVVGAAPAPGVFVLATHEDPSQRRFLELFKLGPGPFYCLYTPYHLCHFEVPITIARAALFRDAAIAPAGPPVVGVVATAKTRLKAGDLLDGIGGYAAYGQCENFGTMVAQNLLPMGLAEGCRMKRDIGRDDVLTWGDVEVPDGRVSDRLYGEQAARLGV